MGALDTNVFPYFNDYTEALKYYTILFRPKIAVQTRELNNLQSMVQKQIERFGNHIFKEGAVVKDGEIQIDNNYRFIKVSCPNGNILESSVYRENNFINKTIQGTSGTKALVVNHLPPSGGSVMFYVKYQGSNTAGVSSTFSNDEVVTVLDEDGDPTGVTATLISSNSVGVGSAANLKAGIFFIRGRFLISDAQSILLDETTNEPSYRIGFVITETIVTPDDDTSLVDNAAGFSNENAPGAHRLKISLTLTKLSPGTQGTDDFIELTEVQGGEIIKNKILVTEYSELEKTLARRTYDESGDYTVTPFKLDVREFYNDSTNRGIYEPDNFGFATQNEAKQVSIDRFGVTSPGTAHSVDSLWRPGSSPTDLINLMKAKLAIGIDPGKAYVRGFEIRTLAREYIDLFKARDFESRNNETIKCPVGNYIRVTNVYGLPDTKNFQEVTLYDRQTSTRGLAAASANAIGTAKVRKVEYESGDIATTEAIYRLYLFDIQINSGYFFFNAKQAFVSGFSADLVLEFQKMEGTVSMDVSSSTTAVTGKGTLWATGDLALVAGDYIFTRKDDDVGYFLRVETTPTSNIALALTSGMIPNTGADVTDQVFYYAFAALYEPQNNILVFPLPQNYIRTVTSDGVTVDTNYTISRFFTAQTVNGSGQIQISTSHADEEFPVFSTANFIAVYTAGANAGETIDLEASDLSYNGTSTQVTISNLAVGDDVAVIAAVRKKQGVPATAKTKSLVSGATLTVTSDAGLNDISLGKADIFRVNAIYMAADFATGATTGDKNITDWYVLDNGQRDEFYDIGSLKKKPGFPKPTGRLLIDFDYFTHGVNGNYFSVDSYTVIAGLEYEQIPDYVSPSLGTTYSLRDCLDFRPRMKDDGSGFANSGGGSLAEAPKDGSVYADFQFYLNRIDKLYLAPTGAFHVIEGVPGVIPPLPEDPTDGMVTHQLNVRAYTVSTKDVFVDFRENKRYTMRDIGRLEKRIENLEYYTSLSLLEKDTADMTIPDAKNPELDRFKNGFIVDSFRGHGVGDTLSNDYRCSVDMVKGECRPAFWSDHVNLIEENEEDEDRDLDHYTLTGDLISLPYEEATAINQPVASNTINVNPYAVIAFIGDIALNPPNDEWKDTERVPDLVVNEEGNFDAISQTVNGIGTIWGEWKTFWVGDPQVKVEKTVIGREVATTPMPHQDPENLAKFQNFLNGRSGANHSWVSKPHVDTWPWREITQVRTITTVDTRYTRSGVRGKVVPKVVTEDLGDKVVSVAYIPYIRSRDVEFRAKGMKPATKLFPYFDNVDVSGYCSAWDDPLVAEPFDSGDLVSTGTPLITDETGKVSGTFRIPNTDTVRFQTGQRTFKLTSNEDGTTQEADSYGSAAYRAQGLLETKQKTIISTRNAEVSWENVVDFKDVSDQSVSERTIKGPWVDPIAETFLVNGKGGWFLTSVDLFFSQKDATLPVIVEIRNVVNGYPGPLVVPFSRVVVDAADVNISDDATEATTFTFQSLVRVEEGQEYAIVIMSNSNRYKAWIATMGQPKVGTEIPIMDQPYPGSFFKSQNASTWTADQYVDLKFLLRRAEFDISEAGTVTFTNDAIPAISLGGDPITTKNGESKIRIHHPNHGFRADGSKNSRVVIAGAVTTNGIPGGSINGTKTILSCDLDSYVIDTGSNATLTGRSGGAGITATENRQMDVAHPVVQQLNFADTETRFFLKACSSKSVHPDASAGDLYVMDSSYTSIIPNNDYEFSSPKMVASPQNETQFLSGEKSLFMRAILVSTNTNVSPIIDLQRTSVITIANRIDDPDFEGDNSINDEDLDTTVAVNTQPSVSLSSSGNKITTTDATVAALLSQMEEGKVISVAQHAAGTLTLSANVSDGDTVVIGGKTYTFQATLTNVDGNVKIGASASVSIDNLIAAITLGSGSGTLYAAATTLHSTVSAEAGAGDTMIAYAKTGGTGGNAITTTETSGTASWGSGTLTGGGTNAGTYKVVSNTYTPSGSPKITLVVDSALTSSTPVRITIAQLGRYVTETASKNGSASAKYLTKRMKLAQLSSGLRINFAAVKPGICTMRVYYKAGRVDDATPFEDLPWVEVEVDGTSGDSTNQDDFRDYNFTLSDLPDYNGLQGKVVFYSPDTTKIVRIRDLRMIALGT